MEVRATRIVLEDATGHERIVMELDHGHPSIKLLRASGHEQMQLRTEDDFSRISLSAPNGNPVIHIVVPDAPRPTGTAQLHLMGDYPGQGRKEIIISIGDAVAAPAITLNANGATIAHLP